MLNNWRLLFISVIAIGHNYFANSQQTIADLDEAVAPTPRQPDIIAERSDRIAALRSQLEASEMVAQIHGTLQQLSETARLRQQLEAAIQQDSYAHTAFQPAASNDDNGPDRVDIITTTTPLPLFPALNFDLIKFLLGRVENSVSLPEPTAQVGSNRDDVLGAAQPDAIDSTNDESLREFIRTSLEEAIKLPDGNTMAAQLQAITPGQIDSGFVNDLLTNSVGGDSATAAISKDQLRETLHLVSVTERPDFTLGGNVQRWHALQCTATSSATQHALVGITDQAAVQLVAEQNGTYRLLQEVRLAGDGPVLASLAYVKWTTTTRPASLNGYVVVAVPGELIFLQSSNAMRELHIVWRWSLQRNVTALLYFQLNGTDTLLVGGSSTGGNAANRTATTYSADVYHFDLAAQNAWLTQKIPLRSELRAVQFMELAREYILAFAQTDSVELMYYSRESAVAVGAQRFVALKTIESPQVQSVACFQIGGLSYIAIGGLRPQILRYHRAEFYAQTVLAASWGLVEHFVAVPARTYRDDLILLVQHRLHIEGIGSNGAGAVLEALIWNGEAFETAALAVPCWLNGRQVSSGISCVLDEERLEGIDGVNVIQHGTNISLLVPRWKAPSGLFTLAFKLEAVDNPTVGANAQYSHGDLLERLNEQTDVITEAERVLQMEADEGYGGDGGDATMRGDWEIEYMQVNELRVDELKQLQYGELKFGDVPWTAEDAAVDVEGMLSELEQSRRELEELESQLMKDTPANMEPVRMSSAGNGQFSANSLKILDAGKRSKRSDVEKGNELRVAHLQADFINDIPVRDFVFIGDDNVLDLHDSDVFLGSENVRVTDRVVFVDKQADADVDTLGESLVMSGANGTIEGDVQIGEINGINVDDLMRNIVLLNVPNVLGRLDVEGDVTFKNKLKIVKLNEFAFPDDFLWRSLNPRRGEASSITGAKHFRRLGTVQMDYSGRFNGLNLMDVFTLDTDQTLYGQTTFAQLSVVDSLNVTGRISGPHLNEMLANPSLLQTKFIQTECQFQQLHVNGPVYVTGTINDRDLEATLRDVVYMSEERTQITGFKTFAEVQAPSMQLSSGLINGVPLDAFVTLNTEQRLQLDALSGNVIFRDLAVDGLFDFVNVTELDENAIRVSGEQYTEVELVFDDDADAQLVADNLDVLGTLNDDIVLAQLVPVDEPITFEGNVDMDATMITNLEMPSGELIGLGYLNGVQLLELEATRFSRTREQQRVLAPYFVRNIHIVGDLDAVSTVNDVSVAEMQQHMQTAQSVPQYLAGGEAAKLDRLIVDGSVQLRRLNGHDFDVIMQNAVWLDRPNRIESRLEFADGLVVAGGSALWTDTLNDVPFSEFVAGMVRRDALDNLRMSGVQTFRHSPEGVMAVNARRLGSVDAAAIVTKRTERLANVNIWGSATVTDVLVGGTLNGTDFNELASLYVFDELNGAHVLRHSHVRFGRDVVIGELWLHQTRPNMSEFLASLVLKTSDADVVTTGRKRFIDELTVKNDLWIENYNGVGLRSAMDAMVMNVNGTTAFVGGDVAFEDQVLAGWVRVDGDVWADTTIMGCDWTEWLREGIRTDQAWMRTESLEFEEMSLMADNVQVTYLNGIAVEGLITLNTEQNFTGLTQFTSLLAYGNVNIDDGGSVNEVDLREMRDNTLMITGNQAITVPTNFQAIRVLNNLQTVADDGNVNGIDLLQMVPLDEDVTLVGSFSFRAIDADELSTDQLVSGIDLAAWTQNTLLRSMIDANVTEQLVTGNWSIRELSAHNVVGAAQLNGQPIQQIAERLRNQSANIMLGSTGAQTDGVCNEMRLLVTRSQQLRYALGYFEDLMRIATSNDVTMVNSVHVFEWSNADFVLLNSGCVTRVFKWMPTEGTLRDVGDVQTGSVTEWLMLATDDDRKELNWVTNTGTTSAAAGGDCLGTDGLNVWNFSGSKLQLVKHIGEAGEYRLNEMRHVVSGSFYALHLRNNTVVEFDMLGAAVEKWRLPEFNHAEEKSMRQESMSVSPFVFLPVELNFGLALSDSSRLCRLSTILKTSNKTRTKRFFGRDLLEQPWRFDQQQQAGGPFARTNVKRAGMQVMPPRFVKPLNVSNVADVRPPLLGSALPADSTAWPALQMKRCNLTWPKCNLDWWKDGTKVEDEENESVGMANADDREKESEKTDDANPEEVVMAMPPTLLADAERTDDNETLAAAPRIDTYGRIEEKAEHLVDKLFGKMFGDPQKAEEDMILNNLNSGNGQVLEFKPLFIGTKSDPDIESASAKQTLPDEKKSTFPIIKIPPISFLLPTTIAPEHSMIVSTSSVGDKNQPLTFSLKDEYNKIKEKITELEDKAIDKLFGNSPVKSFEGNSDNGWRQSEMEPVMKTNKASDIKESLKDEYNTIKEKVTEFGQKTKDNLFGSLPDKTDPGLGALLLPTTIAPKHSNLFSTSIADDRNQPLTFSIKEEYNKIKEKVTEFEDKAKEELFGISSDQSTDEGVDDKLFENLQQKTLSDLGALLLPTTISPEHSKLFPTIADDENQPLTFSIKDEYNKIKEKVTEFEEKAKDKLFGSSPDQSIHGGMDLSSLLLPTTISPKHSKILSTSSIGSNKNQPLTFSLKDEYNKIKEKVTEFEDKAKDKLFGNLPAKIDEDTEDGWRQSGQNKDSIITSIKDEFGNIIDKAAKMETIAIEKLFKITDEPADSELGSNIEEVLTTETSPSNGATSDDPSTADITPQSSPNPPEMPSHARIDTFGEIESNTKDLMDNIMDNTYGPPPDANEPQFDDDDDDEDYDDVGADAPQETNISRAETNVTQARAGMFGVPDELFLTQDRVKQAQNNGQQGGFMDVIRNISVHQTDGTRIVEQLREDSRHRHEDTAQHRSHQSHVTDHEVMQPDFGEADDSVNVGVSRATAENANDVQPESTTLSGTMVDDRDTDAEQTRTESSIGVAIRTVVGVSTTENAFLPGRRSVGAELVALDVGTSQRRLLIGVSEWSATTVQGKQDQIRIYEDILDGRLFQTIQCHRPHSLATMRLGHDTALVFVERAAEVRVFVYRGIEGFVPFAAFEMPETVHRLQAVALAGRAAHSCRRHVLVVELAREVRLLEAVGVGYCGLQVPLECQ